MTITVNTRHLVAMKAPGQSKWAVQSGGKQRVIDHGDLVKRLTPKKEREADAGQQPRQ
jgi:hypothetical protein